jgi:hypothetical protein
MAFAKVIEEVKVKREFVATEYDCCGLCGYRYEAGTPMALMTKAIDARGRIAHPACVKRANRELVARAAKVAADAEAGMVEIPRAKTLLDAIIGNFV